LPHSLQRVAFPRHRAPEARTQERIHLVDLADESGLGAADLLVRPVVRARDWVRCFGGRQESVSLAIPPRQMGVPPPE
jgi:hypothetical protein